MKVRCPVCGQNGSLVLKWVLNNQKAKYTYYYVAHHHTGGITWCYVGKFPPRNEGENEERDEESEDFMPEPE